MNQVLSAGPISKRLATFQFAPAEEIQLIREMLANRGEQEAAKGLEPSDAANLIEFLDSVRLPLVHPVANILLEIGFESG